MLFREHHYFTYIMASSSGTLYVGMTNCIAVVYASIEKEQDQSSQDATKSIALFITNHFVTY